MDNRRPYGAGSGLPFQPRVSLIDTEDDAEADTTPQTPPRVRPEEPSPPAPYFMHPPSPDSNPTVNSPSPYTAIPAPAPPSQPGHASMTSLSSSHSASSPLQSRRNSPPGKFGGLYIPASELGTKEKYGAGPYGWGGDGIGPKGELLSPKTPDPMHDMGKPLPRQGRSRYIIEGGAFTPFTLFSGRGCLNLGPSPLSSP